MLWHKKKLTYNLQGVFIWLCISTGTHLGGINGRVGITKASVTPAPLLHLSVPFMFEFSLPSYNHFLSFKDSVPFPELLPLLSSILFLLGSCGMPLIFSVVYSPLCNPSSDTFHLPLPSMVSLLIPPRVTRSRWTVDSHSLNIWLN